MPPRHRPVANGLRTDHPIPDLPFVEDSHLPLDDPKALEALGRHEAKGSWGREDRCRGGGWAAFTTEQSRYDLAWVVRHHPEHGRSVVLYRDGDAVGVHTALQTALLFRSGGYWWDGVTWYRPPQIWDRAGERYMRRPVPGASIVSAADLLHAGGDPQRGRVLAVADVDVDAAPAGRWLDDLAGWASRWEGAGSLSDCVVRLSAPELTGDELVGVAEFAEIGGVAASTLRAYIARGEGDVPQPQATVGGRSVWARPVAREWAERRRHSTDSVAEVVSRARDASTSPVPVGVGEVWKLFSRLFLDVLWENPDQRRRFALRWRTRAAVETLADDLGWDVAANLDDIVPFADVGHTVYHAVLGTFASTQHGEPDTDPARIVYFLARPVASLLDWLIRHAPSTAMRTIGEIVGEAERELRIPREVAERTLLGATADNGLDYATRKEFFERALPRADGPSR